MNELIVGGPIVFAPAIPDIEITLHLLHGKRFLEAKMYEGAIREFENAEFKIRNMPYDVKSMNDLLPQLRELSARAKSSLR